MATKLILGCGYLGLRVARRWRAAGHIVHAVTRSAQRADIWASEGLSPLVADVTQPVSLADLPAADTVLFSVGHDRATGHPIEEVYATGLTNLIKALPAPPRRFIYISTTGVYGSGTGDWVDETAACHPTRPGGKASLAAEQLLLASPLAERARVLRCAGLYGPGRIPLVDYVRRGEAIPSNPEAALNLIHIDDAANVVTLIDDFETASRRFNVSDGRPVVRREFYGELARLVGAPPPQFAPPEANSDSRRGRADDKRISNVRLLREVPVKFEYPSFREGLAAIIVRDGAN